ncbi:MAG TPA: hypothetical protein VN858_12295, partial [Casimicrobiaceae bacterium]|nr:hypothetical protein [Casimicrobiaceae bacterium]
SGKGGKSSAIGDAKARYRLPLVRSMSKFANTTIKLLQIRGNFNELLASCAPASAARREPLQCPFRI